MNTIPVTVYSYGGCTSCGDGLFNFLRQQGVVPTVVNMQVMSARSAALQMARDKGIADPYFPMIEIGDTVICGFKPHEIADALSQTVV